MVHHAFCSADEWLYHADSPILLLVADLKLAILLFFDAGHALQVGYPPGMRALFAPGQAARHSYRQFAAEPTRPIHPRLPRGRRIDGRDDIHDVTGALRAAGSQRHWEPMGRGYAVSSS